MKTKKMSLANMQGKLSRAEMKNIMGGLRETGIGDAGQCGRDCTGKCRVNNHDGSCHANTLGKCFCVAVY
jgi:hypothetical protein